MNRRLADRLVALFVSSVILVGIYSSYQSYLRSQTFDGMMGTMMGDSMPGTVVTPIWYVLGTIVAVTVIGGVYVAIRDELTTPTVRTEPAVPDAFGPAEKADAAADAPDQPSPPNERATRPTPSILNFLPEDERRVLRPVLDSPGITQIELRDRSEFSKSKVSQTVSALEKRGLLYRERQGRTFRVYPDESIVDTQST